MPSECNDTSAARRTPLQTSKAEGYSLEVEPYGVDLDQKHHVSRTSTCVGAFRRDFFEIGLFLVAIFLGRRTKQEAACAPNSYEATLRRLHFAVNPKKRSGITMPAQEMSHLNDFSNGAGNSHGKSSHALRTKGTTRIASTLVACICLSLPVQTSSGLTSHHHAAFVQGMKHQDAWLARAKRGESSCCFERMARTPLAGGFSILSMCEQRTTPRVLGSRRLARWMQDLGTDGKKFLMSRRLALALHKIASPRLKGASERQSKELEISPTIISSSSPSINDAAVAESVVTTHTIEASTVETCTSLPSKHTVKEPVLQAVTQSQNTPGCPFEAGCTDAIECKKPACIPAGGLHYEEQEWGEIMDLASSPSRPTSLTLSA